MRTLRERAALNVRRYKDTRVIYRRYASLFFVAGIEAADNELMTLEVIHRYVEVLDRYFGNVSVGFVYFAPQFTSRQVTELDLYYAFLTFSARLADLPRSIFNFQKAYAVRRAKSSS